MWTCFSAKKIHVKSVAASAEAEASGGPLPSATFLDKKFFLCLGTQRGWNSSAYVVRVTSLRSLLCGGSKSKPLFKEVWTWDGDENIPHNMGCTYHNSKIFLAGGHHTSGSGSPIARIIDVSALDLSPRHRHRNAYVRFSATSLPPSVSNSSAHTTEMKSGKPNPLVIGIGNDFFVLTYSPRCFTEGVPEFEKYEESGGWSLLPPPLHGYMGTPTLGRCGWVVFNDHICFSTRYGAIAYDVTDCSWELCHLFDNYAGSMDPYGIGWSYPDLHLTDAHEYGGTPFGFWGPAVFYGKDIMICVVPPHQWVVAHLISDGKVVKSQWLREVENRIAFVDGSRLAHLGRDGGWEYYCLVSAGNIETHSLLRIRPFKVTGIQPNSNNYGSDDFLDCFVFDLIDIRYSPSTVWTPLCAFTR